MFTHMVWFRNDLRIHDNLALSEACQNKEARVIALFIATPIQWKMHAMAPRQASFLLLHLNNLQKSLSNKGIPLLYEQVDDFNAQQFMIHRICDEQKVTHLFYNYQYELNEYQRDKAIKKSLKKVMCLGFDDSIILHHDSVMTKKNRMYKVFTSFKNTWLACLKKDVPTCAPCPSVRKNGFFKKNLTNLKFDYQQVDSIKSLLPDNEEKALVHLRNFCKSSASLYEKRKDFPAIDGTSRLSAYLTSGIISTRQCLHQLLVECPNAINEGLGSAWLNELIWREFYRHLIIAHPNLCKHRPFIAWTDNICWSHNKKHFEAWKQGKTGYPIVDAAMRQLKATGWIHNRLRMIVASFLVKDLLIDWRIGELYFISQLVDGDLAANNGGWQWIASTGTDSVPYFRILNPTTQGKKFDSNGEFIRRWLPELSLVPNKYIHNPLDWSENLNSEIDYPRPIIDHKQARLTTIAAYKLAYQSVKKRHEK